MKKERKCYLGLDVSKLWFDVSVLILTEGQKEPMLTEKFSNNASGLDLMDQWLKKLQVPKDDKQS